MQKPKVTVLMPVYNGSKYLREAINSILEQTFTDFELLIIDDYSTDNTKEILDSYCNFDSRINIVYNEENIGLIGTLNKGIQLSKGEYIARMDQDDISVPKRLETQVTFMDKNKEIGICGTWIRVKESNILCFSPTVDDAIKAKLLFESCLYHPTVIIRKSLILRLDIKYNSEMINAEDYDLWTRLALSKDIKFANIAKVLLYYRVHPNVDRQKYKEIQENTFRRIRKKMLGSFSSELVYKNIEVKNINEAVKYELWLKKLKEIVLAKKYCSSLSLSNEFSYQWLKTCTQLRYKYGYVKCIILFLRSSLILKNLFFLFNYILYTIHAKKTFY